MPSESVTAKRVRLIVLPGQKVVLDGTSRFPPCEFNAPADVAAELIAAGQVKRKQTGPPRRARRR